MPHFETFVSQGMSENNMVDIVWLQVITRWGAYDGLAHSSRSTIVERCITHSNAYHHIYIAVDHGPYTPTMPSRGGSPSAPWSKLRLTRYKLLRLMALALLHQTNMVLIG